MIIPREAQGKILRRVLPTIGEYLKRVFGEKVHKPTKLGGPERLDEFIEKGYMGPESDYNRGGVWRLTKRLETSSYGIKDGLHMGSVLVKIEFVVVE